MEKMRSGELYCFAAPELQESFERAATLCARMRTMTVYDENYRKTIEDLIPGIPSTSVVNPPFQCDHGTGIVLGENVFVNYNCVMPVTSASGEIRRWGLVASFTRPNILLITWNVANRKKLPIPLPSVKTVGWAAAW